MWHEVYRCNGWTSQKLDRAFARKNRITQVGMAVGEVLPIGMLEFAPQFFGCDNAGLLGQVPAPVLSHYGGSGILVDGPGNEAYVRFEFPSGGPAHLEAVTLPGIAHIGDRRADTRDAERGPGPEGAAPEAKAAIEDWLTRIGY